MTNVQLRELNNGWLFSCEGHAGYAPAGADIVCAGVSALCMALTRRLEEMSLEGIVHLSDYAISDGEVHLRVFTEDGDKMCALLLKAVFDTVYAGLSALEEEYPEYVQIT